MERDGDMVEISVKHLVDSVISPWFSYSKWMGGVSGIKDSIVATFKNALESARTLFNKFIDWLNTKMKFSWDAVKIAGETIVSAGRIQLFKNY